jgi:hypothetical protein
MEVASSSSSGPAMNMASDFANAQSTFAASAAH